ncbi:MAG: curved DNA-binding protein [Solirubrobacteraceae bacterium]|nr:curved DNA-binding protein [Solirubrobacteraceae bacterium]
MAVGARDFYDVLGVSRDASEEDIRRAYRQLARKNHPDVNKEAGADERFKEIAEAYEVLRDPEKRAQYDRYGADWRAAQQAGARPGGGGGFEGFGGGYDDVRVEFGEGDLGDIFEGLFGGRRGGAGRRGRGGGGGFDGFSMRGADAEAVLEITLEEAAKGGRRRIALDGEDYEVDIPPGVTDGQRIRLAGAGEAGIGGGPSGDLFLRVRIQRHPRFRVDGRDLHTDVRVAPWEAALGASVDVETLDGHAHVRVPEGSSCGRKLRLRGEGLPGPGGSAGDLYAHVKIVVPKKLKREERELFEQLAEVSRFNPRKKGS